jgi:hypothetical protein
MKTPLIFILAFVLFACKKGDSTDNPSVDPIKPEDRERAAQLTQMLENNRFSLKAYYSEEPIDYIDTDQVVKSETELWQYVSPWLKDDVYAFQADGNVNIEQNSVKIESDASPVVIRQYSVEPDEQGVAFKFVGHEYQNLDYRLISFTDSVLKVYALWNGKKVISEYKPAE